GGRDIMSSGQRRGGGQTTMPAYDFFDGAVKKGLTGEGWTITADPYTVRFGFPDFAEDPAAEKVIAAEKGSERIAVEIKSFLGPSHMTSFHSALGQYVNDRLVMECKD